MSQLLFNPEAAPEPDPFGFDDPDHCANVEWSHVVFGILIAAGVVAVLVVAAGLIGAAIMVVDFP